MRMMHVAGLSIILIVLIAAAMHQPEAILQQPDNDSFIQARQPGFKWQGGSTELWIDETPHFTTPLIVDCPQRECILTSPLELKEYYWKVPPSQVWKFTIDSNVAVEVERNDSTLAMRNVGNTPIGVKEIRGSGITGAVIGMGDERDYLLEEPTDFEVKQHG
ncbi:MAG: hypothetical protein KJ709_05860 [Nanoarchaeota archaeon]|nr:hypothetical protein [Nanoarchaeota archaeon]